MITVGNNKIKDVKIGLTNVQKVYAGSIIAWQRNPVLQLKPIFYAPCDKIVNDYVPELVAGNNIYCKNGVITENALSFGGIDGDISSLNPLGLSGKRQCTITLEYKFPGSTKQFNFALGKNAYNDICKPFTNFQAAGWNTISRWDYANSYYKNVAEFYTSADGVTPVSAFVKVAILIDLDQPAKSQNSIAYYFNKIRCQGSATTCTWTSWGTKALVADKLYLYDTVHDGSTNANMSGIIKNIAIFDRLLTVDEINIL